MVQYREICIRSIEVQKTEDGKLIKIDVHSVVRMRITPVWLCCGILTTDHAKDEQKTYLHISTPIIPSKYLYPHAHPSFRNATKN